MKFRPCIDIHNGKVKQIVGGSLLDQGDQAVENFAADQEAGFESTADISGWIADWRRNYGRKCRGIYEGRCKPCNCNIVCI